MKPEPDSSSESQPDGEAVDALSHVQISLNIGGNRRVRVTIEALDGEGEVDPSRTISFTLPEGDGHAIDSGERSETSWSVTTTPLRDASHSGRSRWGQTAPGLASSWRRLRDVAYARDLTLGTVLFGLAIGLYLVTRLVGLADYPIYFFTDEAVQTVLAADLVRDNFVGYDRVFLPTYFQNGPQYNLSLSVYLQLLPYLFFGKSVFVTRAVSVLVTLIAAVSVGLALREVFKLPYWWAGTLLLSITPAWFLHSRTAFETVIATSLYAGFLYLYLLYRTRSPRYLYGALALAGLSFYAYSPAQIYIALTAILLLISDARYHWNNRQVFLRGLGVAALLAIPYVRFRLTHTEAPLEHLRLLGSYWLQPLSFREKAARYLGEYLYGLSPGYWFIPNERDLVRHLMDGYGHILRPLLPFALLGLILALRGIRRPAYRVLLIALLAAPSGAAVVQIGITRLLVFVIPATMITTLGVSRILTWLEKLRLPRTLLAVGLFAGLGLVNVLLLRSALVDGPTWSDNFGLAGMQYGARQVFGEMRRILEDDSAAKIVLSPTWTNGTDVVARFFLDDPLPIEMAGTEAYLQEHLPIDPGTLFVVPSHEYEDILASGKFEAVDIERTLPYPDGQPGFYFLHLRYVDNVDAIFAAEYAERARLLEEEIILDGAVVIVRYSRLDMGQIKDLFDGDPASVTRTQEANPAILELAFHKPRRIHGFALVIGSSAVEVKATITSSPGGEPVEYVRSYQGSVSSPSFEMELDPPVTTRSLRLEVRDTTQLEKGHVHIWELTIR